MRQLIKYTLFTRLLFPSSFNIWWMLISSRFVKMMELSLTRLGRKLMRYFNNQVKNTLIQNLWPKWKILILIGFSCISRELNKKSNKEIKWKNFLNHRILSILITTQTKKVFSIRSTQVQWITALSFSTNPQLKIQPRAFLAQFSKNQGALGVKILFL